MFRILCVEGFIFGIFHYIGNFYACFVPLVWRTWWIWVVLSCVIEDTLGYELMLLFLSAIRTLSNVYHFTIPLIISSSMISNLFVPQFLHDHSKHFYLWYSKSVESQKYITELVVLVIRAHNFLAIVWPSAKQTSFQGSYKPFPLMSQKIFLSLLSMLRK